MLCIMSRNLPIFHIFYLDFAFVDRKSTHTPTMENAIIVKICIEPNQYDLKRKKLPNHFLCKALFTDIKLRKSYTYSLSLPPCLHKRHAPRVLRHCLDVIPESKGQTGKREAPKYDAKGKRHAEL